MLMGGIDCLPLECFICDNSIVCSVLPLGSLNQPAIRLLGHLFSEDKQNKAIYRIFLQLLQIRVF